MTVELKADVGKTASGIGSLIFYGVLAYIAYSIYKGSSLSYLSWKPLSEQEIYEMKSILGWKRLVYWY